ncbi:Retrovirus-related Pol polyprotein from transposon 17.6 [Gossypium australe]|uniref:Retrovirus-related Pol polyprotein from transposon 17.6 n=1 Tax=Gossypium australe TaxID=47621 RepID=A0A5B6WMG0_9ROSI|nr:Retrovirus-related Pol polyprotein from transposon 17.6 [Gossypium australe]
MSFHAKRRIGLRASDTGKRYGSHIGFYRRFIKDFPHISKPLNQLLQKETPFIFDQNCIKAFEVIKEKLIYTIIIIMPIVGAVLGQKRNNLFGAIHYASKTLDLAQCNYTTIGKEILAVVFACKKFRPYSIGNREFGLWIMDRKGIENQIADHLSRIKNNLKAKNFEEIKEYFADKQLFREYINQPRPDGSPNYLKTRLAEIDSGFDGHSSDV